MIRALLARLLFGGLALAQTKAIDGAIVRAPTYAPVPTLLEGRIIQLGVPASW